MSTLFGPNGAGKSSLLNGVLDALRGRARAGSKAYLHVRLTGLASDPDPSEVSPFEYSLWEGLNVDLSDAEGTTRQRLWQWAVSAIAARAEADVAPVGDSIVVSLVAAGAEDHPQWEAFLGEQLGDDEWAQVGAYADWQSRLQEQAELYRTGEGEFRAQDFADELDRAPVLPFLLDSPAREDLPLVAPAEEAGQYCFWPRTWPAPQLAIGRASVSPIALITDGVSARRIGEATGLALVGMASGTKGFIDVIDEEVRFNPAFDKTVRHIEDRANDFFALMGYPHYRLFIDLKAPKAWFVGQTPEWRAMPAHSPGREGSFALAGLSSAEQRWAVAAVQWALAEAEEDGRPRMLMIDEPERGLHRLREKDLPAALSGLCAKDPALTVLAASHAPAFLDLRSNSDILRTTRLPGMPTAVHRIDSAAKGSLSQISEQLGLTLGDVLQLTRVFVLVEGLHDEIVLGHLLAEDLRKASARILALRGAKDLRSVAEAKFLFTATEAAFLVVLDGLLMHRIRPIWGEAQTQSAEGNVKGARRSLSQLEKVPGGSEVKWLQELGHAALDTAQLDRINVHGLRKRDIVMYLPEASFMSTPTTWQELNGEYETYTRQVTPAVRLSFKDWLRKNYNAHFKSDDVLHGAQAASTSREIQDIGLTLQNMARFSS
ncbi:ATP-dependent nuclease [Sinomonas soli]